MGTWSVIFQVSKRTVNSFRNRRDKIAQISVGRSDGCRIHLAELITTCDVRC